MKMNQIFLKSSKCKRLALALALGLPALSSYGATPISFDPDGGGVRGAVEVGSFDWAPGSVLVGEQEGAAGPVIPLSPSSTTLAQTYGHGALIGVHDNLGDPANLDGLNSNYQITFTVSNGVVIATNDTGTEVLFDLDPASGNFFQIIYDDVVNASSLSGAGYSDGLVILSGQLVDLSGNFTTPDAPLEVMDQSPNGDD